MSYTPKIDVIKRLGTIWELMQGHPSLLRGSLLQGGKPAIFYPQGIPHMKNMNPKVS